MDIMRLHWADIGACRRGLNVLASACSGAMFLCAAPPLFTTAALLGRAYKVLFPSQQLSIIIRILWKKVKHIFNAAG